MGVNECTVHGLSLRVRGKAGLFDPNLRVGLNGVGEAPNSKLLEVEELRAKMMIGRVKCEHSGRFELPSGDTESVDLSSSDVSTEKM